jgi:hypothetical protein
MSLNYTSDEMMTIAAARKIRNGAPLRDACAGYDPDL